MHRPCFLVIDREFPGSISTRKLVIETAKFNVLTAYRGQEAIEMLGRFPAVDAVVLDSAIEDIPCAEVMRAVRKQSPELPIVVIQSVNSPQCEGADFYVQAFNPAGLLETLTRLKPTDTDEVVAGEEEAEARQNDGLPKHIQSNKL